MNDIEYMTIDQTRAAAQELLDGTTGELTGAEAERFESLTRHANQLRERQQQRDTAARELVRRLDTSKETSHTPGQGPVSIVSASAAGEVVRQACNARAVMLESTGTEEPRLRRPLLCWRRTEGET